KLSCTLSHMVCVLCPILRRRSSGLIVPVLAVALVCVGEYVSAGSAAICSNDSFRDSKFVAEPLIYALRFPARAFYFTISLVGFCSAMIVASLALLGLQLFLLIPRAMIPIRALWKLLERVFGRRGWKCPFQRIGIFVPVIVLGHALPVEQ